MNPRLVALTAALAFAGCAAVGPNYQAPSNEELDVPHAWNGPTAVQSPTGDISMWWRQLNDATLTSLVTQVLVNNRDLAVTTTRLREARARRDLAIANQFPTVGVSGSATRSHSASDLPGGGTSSLFNVGFDARWEPDLWGGQRRAVEAAQADVSAAQSDIDAARVALAAEVARNYVDVRSLQARLAIARSNLDTQQQILQITEWRAQAGLTTSLDVEQARAGVEQTRAAIPALETSLAEARNRLAVLAGVTPGAFDVQLASAQPLPTIPASIAIGIPSDTLRQRPDLRAAERRLAAETARIGQQQAAMYPNLALTGSLGLQSLTLAGLTGGGATVSQLAAQLVGTIFDAGRVRQQVNIQTAVQERALATYQSTLLTALEDVENALIAFDNAERRRASLASAATAARNAALLAEQRYEAGITDFQTVLDTQRTVLSAEDSLASTEADRVQALVQLYKALGGGWTPDAGTQTAANETPGS